MLPLAVLYMHPLTRAAFLLSLSVELDVHDEIRLIRTVWIAIHVFKSLVVFARRPFAARRDRAHAPALFAILHSGLGQ
jgi:hypothetical protein